MPKMRKPPDVGKSLIPLAQPGAVLVVVARVPRVILGSKHWLVEENVLKALRADELISPFTEIDPDHKILVSTVTPKGKSIADLMIEKAGGYTQLMFDTLSQPEGSGDALSSEIIS